MRTSHLRRFLAVALAIVLGGAPAVATAGPRGGQRPAARGHHSRPRVQDHRRSVRPPAPRPHRHVHRGYWPSSYRYYWPYYYGSYWPYYGTYYDRGYAPPGYAEAVPAAPPPRPRTRLAVAAHAGQLEYDGGADAAQAGLALRLRGRILEGEVEVARRVHADRDRVERSLAATLYANLGDIDAFHLYLLVGGGLLEDERVFGAAGGGLALPVSSNLTLSGDLRAASIRDRDRHDDWKMQDPDDRTVEGRLSLIVDFW